MDFYKNKNCIVTGGAGFIGQNIVKGLIESKANVFVVDNFSYGATRSNVPEGAQTFEGDVRSKSSFSQLPAIKYDVLFHFAAPSSIILFKRNAHECAEVTTFGFLNALDFALKNKISLIYPSTGSLYSGANLPNSEQAELKTAEVNSYANNKLALESLARMFRKEIKILGLRIFAGYGPSEKHKGEFASVLYSFCEKMYKGEPPEIWGDGTQERDFVYIDDVVSAILTLVQDCDEGVTNIGSGKSVSFNQVIAEINKVLSRKVDPVYIPKPNLYLERTLSDNSLLKKYYAIDPTPLATGISNIIKSFGK